MKTIKKSLCMLLSIIMILGTVVVGFNGFDSTNFAKKLSGLFANKAEAASSSITVAVPETIYLNPSNLTGFQYYVNNSMTTDGVVSTDEEAAQQTGYIYFYSPDDLTSCTISVSDGTADYNTATITKDGSSTAKYHKWSMTGGSLSTALASNASGTIKWTFTYDKGGQTYYNYAYSTVYAPLVGNSATAAAAVSGYEYYFWGASYRVDQTTWVAGVHSVTTPSSGDHTGGMASPLTTSTIETRNGSNGTDVNWLTSGAGAGYYYKSDDNAKYTGGSAYITVDSSRYTNFKYIPNFQCGIDFNGCYINNDVTKDFNLKLGYYYSNKDENTANACTATGSGYNSNYSSNYIKRYGNNKIDLNLADSTEPIVVDGRVTVTRDDNTRYSRGYVYIGVTRVNKSGLRKAVQDTMSAGLTPDEWNKISSEYQTACLKLGQPNATAADCSSAESALKGKVAGLKNYYEDYKIEFVVPETIYLTPAAGNMSTFQYYLNNDAEGNVSDDTTTSGEATGYDKYGKVSFKCEAATKIKSIKCNGATINGIEQNTTLISADGISGTTADITVGSSGTNALKTAISASATTRTSTLTWTVEYEVNGQSFTAKQYTVCYAPYLSPVAAGTRAYSNDKSYKSYNSCIGWLSGFHNVTVEKDRYPNNDTYKLLPLLNQIDDPPANGKAPDGWLTETNTGYAKGCKLYNGDNSTGSRGSIAHSGTGYITIDKSRYKNLSQVANLKIGFLQTDVDTLQTISLFLAEYHGTSITTTDGTLNGGSAGNEVAKQGNGILWGNTTQSTPSMGQKYNDVIPGMDNFDSTGTKNYIFGFQCCANGKGNRGRNCSNYLYLTADITDKSSMRSKYYSELNKGRQEGWYTSSSWSTYENALKTTAENLGKVDGNNTSTTTLENAVAGLQFNTGTFTVSYKSTRGITLDAGFTSSYNYGMNISADATSNNFDGYDYKGYIKDNAGSITSTDRSVTISNVCAATVKIEFQYEPHGYKVNYDLNGGAGTSTEQSYNVESNPFAIHNAPTRPGYTFKCWQVSASNGRWNDGMEYDAGATVSTGTYGNVTLIAQWNPFVYFDVNHDNIKPNLITTNELMFDSGSEENGLTVSYDETTGIITIDGTATGSVDIMNIPFTPENANYQFTLDYISGTRTVGAYSDGYGSISLDFFPVTGGRIKYIDYYQADTIQGQADAPSGIDFSNGTFTDCNNNNKVRPNSDIDHIVLKIFKYNNEFKFDNFQFRIKIEKSTSATEYSPVGIVAENGEPYGMLPTLADRTGYTFAGWYTEAEGGDEVTSSTVSDGTSKTVYAHWVEGTYSLGFDSIFDFDKWVEKEAGTHLAGGGYNSSDPNATIEIDSTAKTIHIQGGTSYKDSNDIYTSHSCNDSYYRIAVEPNTSYTYSFDVNRQSGCGRAFVFEHQANGDNASTWIAASDSLYDTESKTWTFTTAPDCRYLVFRYGIGVADSNVTYSNISLVKTADYNATCNTMHKSVTDNPASISVTNGGTLPDLTTTPELSGYKFGGYYGGQNGTGTQYYDAEGNAKAGSNFVSDSAVFAKWIKLYDVMYDNIFDFDAFVDTLNNTDITVDKVNNTLVYNNNTDNNDVYTKPYSSSSAYKMPIIGGHTYKITVNVTADVANGKRDLILFTFADESCSTSTKSIRPDVWPTVGTSGTIVGTIETGINDKYMTLRLGVGVAQSKSTFSNIRIQDITVNSAVTNDVLQQDIVPTVTAPIVAGYIHNGWYASVDANGNGTGIKYKGNEALTGNLQLYSQWEKIANDDVYIMDFGVPATLDVSSNDLDEDTYPAVSVSAVTDMDDKPFSGATVTCNNGVVTFTPNTIISKKLKFTYTTTANAKGEYGIATVTIIPANNVYYEEDFVTFVAGENCVNKWSSFGSGSSAVIAAKRAEENGVYGFEGSAIYGQASSMYSLGTHRELTVKKENSSTDNWNSYAEFTFTGTGFDVYSVTSCQAGYFAVRIKEGGTPSKDDADFKYSYNAYTGYEYKDDKWVPNEEKDKAIYQAPIISKLGLEHGTYTVRIYPLYSAMNDISSRGEYTFYLDAIRIYNPMGTSNEAYNEAGENDAKYLSIRNAIIAAEKAKGAGKEGVPGVSFFSTDVSAKTMTFGDYVSIGSKEDVFLAHNQGVSFGIKYSNGKPANVAIGVRKLEADNKAATVKVIIGNTTKTITVNSTTDIFRNIVNSTELSSYADATDTIPVTITNISGDSGVNISITKLKVTYASGSGHTVEPVKNPVSAPARSMVGDGEATERTVELVFNPEHFKVAVEQFFKEKPTIDVSEVNVEWEKTSVELGDPARLFITAPEKVTKVTVDGSEVAGFETLSDGSKKWTFVTYGEGLGNKEFNVVAFVPDGEGDFVQSQSIGTGVVTFVKPVIDIKDAGIEFENDEIKLNETTTLNIETSTKVAAVYVGDTRYTDFTLVNGKRVFTVEITPEKTGKNDFVIKLESITGDTTETITKSITVNEYVVDSKGVTVKWSAGTIKQYESAILTVKTGENIVKVEADGKAMKLVKTENGEKTWEITYTENNPGTKEVNIKLTDENEMKSENIKSGKLTIRKLTFWERIVRFFKKLFGLI